MAIEKTLSNDIILKLVTDFNKTIKKKNKTPYEIAQEQGYPEVVLERLKINDTRQEGGSNSIIHKYYNFFY